MSNMFSIPSSLPSTLTSIVALVILCATMKYLSRPTQSSPIESLNRLVSIYKARQGNLLDLWADLTSIQISSLRTGNDFATNIDFRRDVNATTDAVKDLTRVLDELADIKKKVGIVFINMGELEEQIECADEAQALWFEAIEEVKKKWQMQLSELEGKEVKTPEVRGEEYR